MKKVVHTLIVIISICGLVYLFISSKARKTTFENMENFNETRLLGIEIGSETLRCEKELLSSFLILNGSGKLPPGGGQEYEEFSDAYNRCITKLESLHNSLVALKTNNPSLKKLKSLSGMLIAYQKSLAGSEKFCADWLAFADGTPEEIACIGIASDVISEDFHRTLKEYRGLDRLLAKPGGGWTRTLNLSHSEELHNMNNSHDMPNIVFILVDALRADEIFRESNEKKPVMPFLRKLASEGVTYNDASAPSATTLIVIPSIFTGMNPVDAASASGSESWNYKKSLVPHFQKLGYFTAAYSANSLISPAYNFSPGFSYFKVRNWLPAGVVLPEALSLLQYRTGNNPFFLYLHLIDPHDPYFPPVSSSVRNSVRRDDSFIADPNIIRSQYVRQGIDPREHISSDNIYYLRELYDSEASYTDSEIEKFFSGLDKEGFLENTLIIITADHGEAFLEHGDVKHSFQFYDEYMRVPLILWGNLPADLKPGTRISTPHSTTELFPSLLKWMNVDLNPEISGRSGLFSETPPQRPVVAAGGSLALDRSELGHRLYALRDEHYKLIYDSTSNKYALFDLDTDPGEATDVSQDKQDIFTKLKSMMETEFHFASQSTKPVEHAPSPKLNKELKDLGYIR